MGCTRPPEGEESSCQQGVNKWEVSSFTIVGGMVGEKKELVGNKGGGLVCTLVNAWLAWQLIDTSSLADEGGL